MLSTESANITTKLRIAINQLPEESEIHRAPYMHAVKGMVEMVDWLMVDSSKENRNSARVITKTARKVVQDVLRSRVKEDGDFYILDNLDLHIGYILMELRG